MTTYSVIYMNCVEVYSPERVQRQFGYTQVVPIPPPRQAGPEHGGVVSQYEKFGTYMLSCNTKYFYVHFRRSNKGAAASQDWVTIHAQHITDGRSKQWQRHMSLLVRTIQVPTQTISHGTVRVLEPLFLGPLPPG